MIEQAQGRKVDTPLLYPAYLNTLPFLASSVLQKRHVLRQRRSARPQGGNRTRARMPAPAHTVYELYAVVVHKGHLQVIFKLQARVEHAKMLLQSVFVFWHWVIKALIICHTQLRVATKKLLGQATVFHLANAPATCSTILSFYPYVFCFALISCMLGLPATVLHSSTKNNKAWREHSV